MEYTVERFGKYTRTLTPGLDFIWPIFDRIGHKMIMMEQVMDVPSQEVITKYLPNLTIWTSLCLIKVNKLDDSALSI
jgi:regulator of protease activity HflC (stomatin/prohibitin superfamily)